jgi:3-(3-hydroxy-phenyl)propionate hydroxylase
MSAVERTQVVIVGAGPVGTVAATFLAQAGVDVIVVESNPDCAQDLRASTFHPPTLELLDQIGITPMLLERGLKAPVYHWRERATGEVIDFDLSELADMTRYPFRIQCEQYHLARALASALEDNGHAQVRFARRLLSFEQDETGVTVHVEAPLSVETIRADFLIGADGANSLVRKWLGIAFDGFTYPEKFLCLTTETPLEAHLPNLAPVNYVSDPNEWVVLLRVPSLWRVLVPAEPEAPDADLLSDANKTAVFSRLLGDEVGPGVETHHRTIYRVHQRVAQSFLHGRVAIIGDAAHLNNPLGGFGMNSGVHDAFNLCTKLVDVLTGQAGLDLLGLFDRQRRQVTYDFTQAQTMQNMEMMRGGQGEGHARRRAAMDRIRKDDTQRRQYLIRQAMFESLAQAAAIQ